MARAILGAGTAQAVTSDAVYLKSALLTAGSADATAVVYSNASGEVYLSAKAGTTAQFFMPGQIQYVAHLIGPVTADVVGTGAHLRLDF